MKNYESSNSELTVWFQFWTSSGLFWTILDCSGPILDSFWKAWTVLDQFWTVLERLGQFWKRLDSFGPVLDQFWTILDCSRPFWTVLGQFWTDFGQFLKGLDSYGPILDQFWTSSGQFWVRLPTQTPEHPGFWTPSRLKQIIRCVVKSSFVKLDPGFRVKEDLQVSVLDV